MKKRLYALILAFCMILPLLVSCGEAVPDETDTTDAEYIAEGLHLIVDGTSDYVIVKGENASPADANAASELQAYLKQISGAELPIVTDTKAETAKEIIVGKTNRETEGEFPRETFNEDGFIIKTVEDKLYIVGTEERGTLYGVYEFLESYLGCRFYTMDVEIVPEMKTISIASIEEDKQIPTISWRRFGWKDTEDIDFCAKRKISGCGSEYDSPEWGGKKGWDGGHNMTSEWGKLVTVSQFYEEHPEYFALVNGVRDDSSSYYTPDNGPQLCLSNPEVVEVLTNQVLKKLRDGVAISRGIMYVAQMDGAAMPCECDECHKINEEEGGSLAGTLIRAVNAVANAVKEEYPDLRIMTLAYNYSKSPTITKPAENVIIMQTVQRCGSHPVYSDCTAEVFSRASYVDGTTKSFAENLIGWGEITDNIFIYEYNMNYQDYPCTLSDFYNIYNDIQFYYNNGMRGMYAQGVPEGRSTEFGELRVYLISKLLWNPDMTEEEYWNLFDEFLADVYGPGWTYVKEYIELAESLTEDHCFMLEGNVSEYYPMPKIEVHDSSTIPDGIALADFVNYEETDWSKYWNWYIDVEESPIISKGEELFAKAMELAETDSQKRELDKCSIQVEYIKAYYLYYKYHYSYFNARKVFNSFCNEYPEQVAELTANEKVALQTALTNYPKEQVRMIYENYCKELIEHMKQYTVASSDYILLEDAESFNFNNRPEYWHMPYLAEW